jgi:hypothetical protein
MVHRRPPASCRRPPPKDPLRTHALSDRLTANRFLCASWCGAWGCSPDQTGIEYGDNRSSQSPVSPEQAATFTNRITLIDPHRIRCLAGSRPTPAPARCSLKNHAAPTPSPPVEPTEAGLPDAFALQPRRVEELQSAVKQSQVEEARCSTPPRRKFSPTSYRFEIYRTQPHLLVWN